MLLLLLILVTLFVGYPVLQHFLSPPSPVTLLPGFNFGGRNATGQVPSLPNLPSLIDKVTPEVALSRTGSDGRTWNLVFSDEFETDGRTFWPGDDPFWEAQDLNYWYVVPLAPPKLILMHELCDL